jgi:isochorismate synthase
MSASRPQPVRTPAVPDALADFCRRAAARATAAGRPVLAAWSEASSTPLDPLAVSASRAAPGSFRFFWEHPQAGFALAGAGLAGSAEGHGADRFGQVAAALEPLLAGAECGAPAGQTPLAPYAVGGFSFFPELSQAEWPGFDSGRMVLPEWLALRQGAAGSLLAQTLVAPGTAPDDLAASMRRRLEPLRDAARRPPPALPGPSGGFRWMGDDGHARWLDVVRTAREAVRGGTLRKVVLALSRELECTEPPDPAAMLGRLRRNYPDCFTFLVDPGAGRFYLGATPERLVKTENGSFQLTALAGTMPRGSGEDADRAMGRRLFDSPKERQEHAVVVDDMLEALAPFGQVDLPEIPQLKALANVWHLHTPIVLRPRRPVSLLTLVERLHPTPAVGGLPRGPAFDLIRRMENFDRGWYAGPVGWLNGNGQGEFAVALRSGTVSGKRVRLFAGGGIMAESDPEREFEETQVKFQPLLSALGQE